MRKIITIDCQYLYPKYAAAYLVIDGGRALFIENNTTHSVPLLLAALAAEGLKPDAVEYVIITHVHLDHAGGSSALMKACPNATLLAHPRAAKHVIDPTKLVASARIVYGDQEFERLYGTIEPIHADRVREMADNEELDFGSGPFKFLHTRGHANHHFCVYDLVTKSIFTGDAFGLAYPALQDRTKEQAKSLFIFPSTSPTDFDAAEAIKSVERIVNSNATTAYLTHFGAITELELAKVELLKHLNFAEKILTEAATSTLTDPELEGFIKPSLRDFFSKQMAAVGLVESENIWKLLKLDLDLNAAGLAHIAKKRREVKV